MPTTNYTGIAADLLNPYALLGGLTTLLLFFTHGVCFVALKTEGDMRERARRLAARSGVITIVVAAAFLVWTSSRGRHAARSLVARRARGRRAHRSRWCSTCGARRAGRSASGRRPSRRAVLDAVRSRCSPTSCRRRNDPANSLTIDERVEHRLHADGHELGGARLPAARAALPGLDVLGLPQARHARASSIAAAVPRTECGRS